MTPGWHRTALTAALTCLALVVVVGLGTAGAAATPTTALAGTTPVLACAQVAQLDLGALRGASAEVTSATPLAAKNNSQGPWDASGSRPHVRHGVAGGPPLYPLWMNETFSYISKTSVNLLWTLIRCPVGNMF